MNEEILQQAWQWLLGLSKVQLILLGGGLAFMVAASKILRVLFLLSVLLFSLVFGLPHAIKYYKETPLSKIVDTLLYQEAETAKDVPPPAKKDTE